MRDPAAYYEQPTLWDRPLTKQEEERLHLVRAVWPEGVRTVLDVGCGNGAVSNYLPEGVEVTGIDLSRAALQHFQRQKVLGSLARLPFRDESFDLVICADTLEHLLPGDFELGVAELNRVTGRFLLITSPHDEDLQANSTKCRRCGTIFHVNWHLRSFTKEALESLFSDCFRLRCFTFFGERWLRQHPLVTRLQHSLADRFSYWEDAVCPLCGIRQGDLPAPAGDEKLIALLRGLEEMLPPACDARRENRCEVLLLFERQRERSENVADLPRQAAAIILRPEDEKVRAQLIFRDRGTIEVASPLCASPVTYPDPERAYLLVNDQMDWGEPYLLDGRWVRNYEDRGGTDAHAAFVLPWDSGAPKTLVVFYKDATTEPIHIQVYNPKQGYVPVGTLSGVGTGKWREAVFSLPAEMEPGREGLIAHFVVDGVPHPREPHPIESIGFLRAATQSIPLELHPLAEHGKNVRVADYPQAACSVQGEPILKTDRLCLATLVLPGGERYVLGQGGELPIPVWLHEALRGRAVNEGQKRLQAEVATLQAALREREVQVTRLQDELGMAREDTDTKALAAATFPRSNLARLEHEAALRIQYEKVLGSKGIREIYWLKRRYWQWRAQRGNRGATRTVLGIGDNLNKRVRCLIREARRLLGVRKPGVAFRASALDSHDGALRPRTVTMLVPDDRIDRRVLLEARSLVQAGWSAVVIAAPAPPEDSFVDEQVFPDVHIVRIDTSRAALISHSIQEKIEGVLPCSRDWKRVYWYHNQFLAEAVQYPAEVVVAHDLPVLPAAIGAAQLHGSFLVYDAHELYPEQKLFTPEQAALYREVEAKLILKADLVITVNQSIAEEMVKRYNIALPEVILNAPDIQDLTLPLPRQNLLRKSLRIAESIQILLFQGGLSPNRNLENLVEALSMLRHEDVVLVFMGPDGGKLGELRRQSEKLGMLNRRVFFHAAVPQTELLNYTASADAGIIPYPHVDINSTLCSPNKLFEYLVAELPILANDSPELRRFVAEQGVGAAYPMGTAREIATAIDSFFDSDLAAFRERLRQLSPSFVWSIQGNRIVALYEQIRKMKDSSILKEKSCAELQD